MPLVKVLPDILASQVAAGEVVERPASVVKELVENSLDAEAKAIMVDIEKGGIALIRVSDDGCGMEREDAILALERHATSKLRVAEDLATVMTLGFRGEAVPSIASVAKFKLITRRANDVSGTEITVDGGILRDVRDAGGAPGTMIEARSLFFNMPARRKFMRAESTEASHVELQIRLHALAAPHVRFRFRRDGDVIFDYPSVIKPIDRVRQILGNDLGKELLSIPTQLAAGMSVMGFLLPAQHARKGRRHQYIFLNGRPIEDNAVTKGLAEGFRGHLQEGLHPAAWLWLDIEPQWVDVNVHPAKREVRFHRPYEVRDLVTKAVASCLKPAPKPQSTPLPAANPIPSAPNSFPTPPQIQFHPSQPDLIETLPSIAPLKIEHQSSPFRIIGMLQERYVILESSEGLVLFDPKAAHERILFEKLSRSHKEGLEIQSLLIPLLFELDPRDLDLLLKERVSLLEAGIEIEAFGGNTLQIRSVPAVLPSHTLHELMDGFLEEILHGTASAKKFAFDRICRAIAMKSALFVTPRIAEAETLLEELFLCDLPYCAADGRPTLTEYNRKDIDRRFGNGRI